MQKLEYLWLDGCNPTAIRSKTKVVKEFLHRQHEVPEWDRKRTHQSGWIKPVSLYRSSPPRLKFRRC